MMPEPTGGGQCEQARQYFCSAPHPDHHVAMTRAWAKTLQIFAPQLLDSAWAGLSADDKVELMRKVVIEWRRHAGIFFEEFREVPDADECFRSNEGRATTWTEVKLQLERGVKNMFDASSADRVHADLYARTGGCLCWGTWTLLVDPAGYEQFSTNVFPFLRPFGADCVVSELVVKIASHVFRIREILTKAEIKTIFHDFTLWGELSAESQSTRRFAVFIMKPIIHKGCEIPGLVWVNHSSCSRILAVADDLKAAGFRPDVPERKRTTYSDVPIKLRATLEKSGCAVDMEQITRLCGESAVVEHLRRVCRRLNRPDVHGDLLIKRDASGNVMNAVEGKVVWSESGRNETVGHWGVAVEHPTRPGEVLILSTNMHMAIAPEMKLLGEDVLRIGSSESHLAKVLLGYIQRTNIEIHGDENVFIGSKWTHAERECNLPRFAENGIAAIQLIREEFPLLTDVKSRDIRTLEYFTANPRRREPWLNNALKRIDAAKTRMREDTRWSCRDLTVDGTRERMYEADQRSTGRAAHRATTDEPILGLNFGCNLIFFGDAFGNQGVPDRAVIAAVETGVALTADSTYDVNDDEFSDLNEDSDEDSDEDEPTDLRAAEIPTSTARRTRKRTRNEHA